MDNRGSSEDDKRELRECGGVGSFCGGIQEGGEKAYHGVCERTSAENRSHSFSFVFVICTSQLEREAVQIAVHLGRFPSSYHIQGTSLRRISSVIYFTSAAEDDFDP